LARLLDYAITGTVGHLVVRAAVAVRPTVAPAARRAVVSGLAAGMTTGRRMVAAAEEARLRVGDLMAEAHAKVGEPAPAPVPSPPKVVHDHEH